MKVSPARPARWSPPCSAFVYLPIEPEFRGGNGLGVDKVEELGYIKGRTREDASRGPVGIRQTCLHTSEEWYREFD